MKNFHFWVTETILTFPPKSTNKHTQYGLWELWTKQAPLLLLLLQATTLKDFPSYNKEGRTPINQGQTGGDWTECPERSSWLECTRADRAELHRKGTSKVCRHSRQVLSWIIINKYILGNQPRPKKEPPGKKKKGLRAYKLPEIVPISTN